VKALLALFLLTLPVCAAAQDEGVISDIRVHGNHTTSDADVLGISGLHVGEAATEARLKEAERLLRGSHRFEGVEVRKRYASIEDPSQILIILVVDEYPAVDADHPQPGPMRRLGFATMWLPVLNYADGYGMTYGVRFSFVDALGPHTRISVPLTWGGERRAGFEVERTFSGPFINRVSGAVSSYRRVNPRYDTPDLRQEVRGRVEHSAARWLRVGASIRTARVDFASGEDQHTAGGFDLVVDTRLDPSFPRKAVHLTTGWEHMAFEPGSVARWYGDLRGYAPLGGARVLALRAQFSDVNAALPPSEEALLGGSGSLRGYATGYRAGDNLAAVSAEVRVPLTSPLRVARLGVKGFVDAGAVWSHGERLVDQQFDRGIGGGVYAGIAVFMINVDVAWPESGGPRVHVGMGVTF
jgi:outer membrane protein assembly factor BamA